MKSHLSVCIWSVEEVKSGFMHADTDMHFFPSYYMFKARENKNGMLHLQFMYF